MNIILIILSSVIIYNVLSVIFKVPSFSTYKAYKKAENRKSYITELVDKLAKKITPKINLSIVKKNKIEKLLIVANSETSPEEFVARTYVVAILPLGLIFILFFINPAFSILPIIVSFYLYRREYNMLKADGEKRKRKIETEILKFVMYMSSALKSERNIITCIEGYNRNFDTALTEELNYTLADMKTGNYEKALRSMDARNNSTSISKLTRGLLSSMKGENMTVFFDNLGYELSKEWEENLKKQALEKAPQISKLSYILFAVSIATVFVILANALMSSTMLFGGI